MDMDLMELSPNVESGGGAGGGGGSDHTDFLSFMHQQGTTDDTGSSTHGTVSQGVVILGFLGVLLPVRLAVFLRASSIRRLPSILRLAAILRTHVAIAGTLPGSLAGLLVDVEVALLPAVPARHPWRGQGRTFTRPRAGAVVGDLVNNLLNEIHDD